MQRNKHFSKEIEMAHKYMKKSTPLGIRQFQIKTILRFHFTLVRMTLIKERNKTKWWQGCGGKGHFCVIGGL
jgi:hypothetical protein